MTDKTPAMPEFIRVLVKVQGGEMHSTEAQFMSEEIGYLVCVPREWQPAALQSAQPAAPQGVIAWAHPDGRVVPASTKEHAGRDGGAMASSLAGYTIPCVAAQPAAAVSDAEIVQAAVCSGAELHCRTLIVNGKDAHDFILRFARAILALRPQAVPMTDEQANKLAAVGPVYAPDGKVVRTPQSYRDELRSARVDGIRLSEAHHGITQRADGGEG